MKTYKGYSNPKQCEFEVFVHEGSTTRSLNPRLDLHNHSPTGLSWGYAGSGPAQCALAILADCIGDKYAQKYYQDFKHQVIAHLPNNWEMNELEIGEWRMAHAN